MQEKTSRTDNSEKSVSELLQNLSTPAAGAAWAEFLDRYAQLIMNTASQFEYQSNRINECFLFVCEKLNENRFRRLLKFNTRGSANFSTWLTTVTFNLCVDWHRQEYGRVTMLPKISALPVFDQMVYRLAIEQDMDKETCFQTLNADYPDLTRELISGALKRIYSTMTPRQRWQISVRNRGRKQSGSDPLQGHMELLPDPKSGPEHEAEVQQQLETIHKTMASLPGDQRLLLQLRFQQGLSLEKIAELTQLGDSNRVWRHIQAAISALRQQIFTENTQQHRKN